MLSVQLALFDVSARDSHGRLLLCTQNITISDTLNHWSVASRKYCWHSNDGTVESSTPMSPVTQGATNSRAWCIILHIKMHLSHECLNAKLLYTSTIYFQWFLNRISGHCCRIGQHSTATIFFIPSTFKPQMSLFLYFAFKQRNTFVTDTWNFEPWKAIFMQKLIVSNLHERVKFKLLRKIYEICLMVRWWWDTKLSFNQIASSYSIGFNAPHY